MCVIIIHYALFSNQNRLLLLKCSRSWSEMIHEQRFKEIIPFNMDKFKIFNTLIEKKNVLDMTSWSQVGSLLSPSTKCCHGVTISCNHVACIILRNRRDRESKAKLTADSREYCSLHHAPIWARWCKSKVIQLGRKTWSIVFFSPKTILWIVTARGIILNKISNLFQQTLVNLEQSQQWCEIYSLRSCGRGKGLVD